MMPLIAPSLPVSLIAVLTVETGHGRSLARGYSTSTGSLQERPCREQSLGNRPPVSSLLTSAVGRARFRPIVPAPQNHEAQRPELVGTLESRPYGDGDMVATKARCLSESAKVVVLAPPSTLASTFLQLFAKQAPACPQCEELRTPSDQGICILQAVARDLFTECQEVRSQEKGPLTSAFVGPGGFEPPTS
jgi:hypothetical protein